MYQDDSEALLARADAATREAERLRHENDAMRRAVAGQAQAHPTATTLAWPANMVYRSLDVRALPFEERARLARHSLTAFPVWLVGLLNVVTFGLFPLIHFGLMNDKLPRAAANDPSAGKAIGFQFVPYYNLYWVIFSSLRFSDRLSLQFRVRGIARTAPRGLMLASAICTVIPYINFLAIPILWTITVCLLQSTVNELAALGPDGWDAAVAGPATGPTGHYTR